MGDSKIIMQDVGGIHNKDPAGARARIIKGGSWKQQRIVVVLPSASLIPAKVALSHWNLGFPPNNGVVRLLAQGLEVGDAYSTAIKAIIEHPELSKWEYLLTIEADNMPPFDGVLKLLERMEANPEFDCIGGLYFTKGPGGQPQIWGDIKDPIPNYRPQPPRLDGGLIECWGTGMGFNLWRLKMFKDPKLRQPWFVTLKGQAGQGMATQDLYFWADARKYGHRCAIDCSVRVGHYDFEGKFGPPDTVW